MVSRFEPTLQQLKSKIKEGEKNRWTTNHAYPPPLLVSTLSVLQITNLKISTHSRFWQYARRDKWHFCQMRQLNCFLGNFRLSLCFWQNIAHSADIPMLNLTWRMEKAYTRKKFYNLTVTVNHYSTRCNRDSFFFSFMNTKKMWHTFITMSSACWRGKNPW